jgi:CubicO group peptidase (beta-lactamase class C family)
VPGARGEVVANRVEEVVEEQLDHGIVGIAVAVVAGDDVLWSGGFGRLDVDRPQPITTATVFPIQSVSKSIVATALMGFVETGAIGLDDPVNEHLRPVGVANDWEERSPVTIRQLLTHTAGLPMTTGRPPGASLEDQVAHHVRTEAEPGTRLIYANWGYDVLGYLVGRLNGSSWDQAVRDSVLQPLGMRATAPGSASVSADLERPTGHGVSQLDGSHLRLGLLPPPTNAPLPSGGLVSTVEDLARFLIAHLNGGGGIVAPGTVADMHRLHAPLGAGGGGMGLGFRIDLRRARPFFCHAGDGMGFTTFIGGHPDEHVGVVLLMNTGDAQEARSVIARRALDSVLGAATPRGARAGTRAVAGPPAGGYRSTYWGVAARVDVAAGIPVVITPPNAIAFAPSTGRLAPEGGRWQADGGMFDGCELDFETTVEGGPRFYGGLYPFEFVADDAVTANMITLPVEVDETGELNGAWAGTTDTPLGPIPLELDVDAAQHCVTITVMGTAGTDPEAETRRGWIRARFDLDIVGFGPLIAFARLGLVGDRFEGLLYIRTDDGEFSFPAVLSRA